MIYDDPSFSEQPDTDDARIVTLRHFGKALAEKASGALCRKLAAGVQRKNMLSVFRESLPGAGQPENTLVEFSGPGFTIAPLQAKESAVWSQLEKIIAQVNQSPIEVILKTQQVIQQQRMKDFREKVLQVMGAHTGYMESRIEKKYAQQAGAISSAGRLTTTCWLDQTIKTIADVDVLAEMAADNMIARLDVPRPLKAEISGTADVVDATKYRGRSGATGKGIIVAVIDGEADSNHQALKGRVVHRKNYTREPWGSPDKHGTAVAGIIASNDAVFSGIAPGVTIYNYKVLATLEALNASNFEGRLAIQNALEDGVHIANCSWGDGPAGDGTGRTALACNNAWNLGMTIVKSAGNAGPGASTLTSPADAEGIIVVGATGKDGKLVEGYSSRGPTTDGRGRPHVLAPGGNSFDEMISCSLNSRFTNVTYGTSYAAPHVSGLLALILEQMDLSPDEQRNFLIELCAELPGFGSNDQGHGLVSMVSKP